MNPSRFAVFALLESGENLVNGLPHVYQDYYVHVRNAATITAANVDYMLTWNKSIVFQVYDNENVAYNLTQRIGELKAFQHLTKFSVSVQQKSYKELSLKTFFENLTTLMTLSIYTGALDENQMKEFVEMHPAPEGWKTQTIHKSIQYQKDGN